jgi:hypothetical protein
MEDVDDTSGRLLAFDSSRVLFSRLSTSVIFAFFNVCICLLSVVMPQSRTNLNPEPKTSLPYVVGLLLRFSTFGAAILILLAGLLLTNWWLIIIGGFGVTLGIYDLIQSKHSILSNYPVAGHIRYVLEDFRP